MPAPDAATAWDMISAVYESQAGANPPAAAGMLDLVDHLRTLPDLADVQPGVAGLALALGVAGTPRRVHVNWVRPWTYSVFLDFCEPAFYGERVEVAIEDVVVTLRAYLDRLRADGDG